ncbi:cell division protein kinase [Myriangium duriaei CBS 260.36]|uniref:cyclin-dependent kinase n=1 Tax=Myriangium duriaei CBS 260.36 TaxID=1168546 RepID=A0A9P4JAI6_9PEZI|nr:cell division protein kinase [Myriangium duriaei CBS 260.36]
MMSDWHELLNFSDRLASITRMQIAIHSSTGSPHSAQDALTKAKAFESEAYRFAKSTDLYYAEIAGHVQRAEQLPHHSVVLDLDVNDLVAGGVSIGAYVNAHHHKDGLLSTVYKAKSMKRYPGWDSVWKTGVVALKVTRPSAMVPPHDSKREARILSAATGSKVVPLFDTFVTKDSELVLVFPFLTFDLGTVLKKGPLAPRRAKSVLSDLLSALSHIHSLGMIHRDVKPSNILLRDLAGPAVLADFGIAWMKGDPASEASDEKILDVGTTCYRPPELMFGNQRYDESLDIWAAGCVAAQVTDLGPRTLFDSGDLGSDLALIKSIFETLGTPDLRTWPEAGGFPDWGKMSFYEYPPRPWDDVLTRASVKARDFVASMVRYESSTRLRPSQALQHPFLCGDNV